MWRSGLRISTSALRLDVGGGDVGRAADVEAEGDRLVGVDHEHEVLEVQDDVGDVLGDTRDGVELVEGVVEAHLGDRRAGDRRQQGAAQRVAEGVAEAGLERADGEQLPVALLLAEGFDGGALNDQHGLLPLIGVLRDERGCGWRTAGADERSLTWSRARR